MYDDEKNDMKKLTVEKKREIAQVVQLQLSDVVDLVHKYK